MNDERIAGFFDKMVRAGVVKANIDYRKSYTLRFVNKGVGLDLRPKDEKLKDQKDQKDGRPDESKK
jgi:NitT/TauT family transport system substrate-binding protein